MYLSEVSVVSYVLLEPITIEELLKLIEEEDPNFKGEIQGTVTYQRLKIKAPKTKFVQYIPDIGKLKLGGFVLYNVNPIVAGAIAQRLAGKQILLAYKNSPDPYWVKSRILSYYSPNVRRLIYDMKKKRDDEQY